MSITDELRKYANTRISPNKGMLTTIADRIDAEHDKALNSVDSAYDSGYNVGYDEGFASADDWLGQHEDAMAEHGWMRLPVDADGMPIRVGDVIAYEDNTKPKEVVALVPPSVVMVDDGPRYADMCRHYHAPTVEDVLREFAEKIIDSQIPSVHPTYEEVIAEYVKRMTLIEEVDE